MVWRVARPTGFEPVAFGSGGRRSIESQWSCEDEVAHGASCSPCRLVNADVSRIAGLRRSCFEAQPVRSNRPTRDAAPAPRVDCALPAPSNQRWSRWASTPASRPWTQRMIACMSTNAQAAAGASRRLWGTPWDVFSMYPRKLIYIQLFTASVSLMRRSKNPADTRRPAGGRFFWPTRPPLLTTPPGGASDNGRTPHPRPRPSYPRKTRTPGRRRPGPGARRRPSAGDMRPLHARAESSGRTFLPPARRRWGLRGVRPRCRLAVRRPLGTVAQMRDTVMRIVGRNLLYHDLITDKGLDSGARSYRCDAQE